MLPSEYSVEGKTVIITGAAIIFYTIPIWYASTVCTT